MMHMLFNIDNTDQPLDKEVGESAIKAAVNFIQLACKQTSYIAGKGTLQEEMDKYKEGTHISVTQPSINITYIETYSLEGSALQCIYCMLLSYLTTHMYS